MSPLEKERLYQEFKERLKRDLFADESNVAQLLKRIAELEEIERRWKNGEAYLGG